MSEALDKLTSEVTGIENVRDGVKAFVSGLAAQIKDLADNQAAILALSERLHAASGEIATAITANTVAAA
jgi:hypothetical protein